MLTEEFLSHRVLPFLSCDGDYKQRTKNVPLMRGHGSPFLARDLVEYSISEIEGGDQTRNLYFFIGDQKDFIDSLVDPFYFQSYCKSKISKLENSDWVSTAYEMRDHFYLQQSKLFSNGFLLPWKFLIHCVYKVSLSSKFPYFFDLFHDVLNHSGYHTGQYRRSDLENLSISTKQSLWAYHLYRDFKFYSNHYLSTFFWKKIPFDAFFHVLELGFYPLLLANGDILIFLPEKTERCLYHVKSANLNCKEGF